MNNILALKSQKYELQLDNFEGPLDLLCYLVDKNKMDIYQIEIHKIANQYIEYLKIQEELNLEIASEFIVMASTLLLIKSNGLLPKYDEEESDELSEEELVKRIIEYKQYKEISNILKSNFEIYSERIEKSPEYIELPNQQLEESYNIDDLVKTYLNIIKVKKEKVNENAKNIEKIAVHDNYSVYDKIKEIFKALLSNKKIVFNKLFSKDERSKEEIITAFSGMLELSRKEKVETKQDKNFGDIVIQKKKKSLLNNK